VGQLTFRAEPLSPRDAALAVPPFEWSSPAPISGEATAVVKRGINGVTYDMALRQAEYGYRYLYSYRVTGKQWYLQRARAQADYLIQNRLTYRRAWFYRSTFVFQLDGKYGGGILAPPWISGIGQGTAVGFFARMWEITGDPAYKTAAERTLGSFLLAPNPSGLWISRVDSSGYLRLEQYPGSNWSFIYNGHNQAALGLLDYYRVTGDERALRLCQGAFTSSLAYGESLRNPGWVSAYSIAARAPYTSYHRRVCSQLLVLYSVTNDLRFAHLFNHYDDDFPIASGAGRATIVPGSHLAYRFNASGAAIATAVLRPTVGTTYNFSARVPVRGRSGYWLALKGGRLSGYYVQERPEEVYVRGALGVAAYDPVLKGRPRRGTWPLFKTSASGRVTRVRRATLAGPTGTSDSGSPSPKVTAAASIEATLLPQPLATRSIVVSHRAVVNGVACVRLAAGPYAGWWVPRNAVVLP
jgi:hypothetical protein